MLSAENILRGSFDSCDFVFTKIEDCRDVRSEKIYIRPAGCYLQIYHKGDWDTIQIAYRSLLQYAEENALKLTGFSYEAGVVDERAISNLNDYVTRILIRAERLP